MNPVARLNRIIACVAVLLGAVSILITVLLFVHVNDQRRERVADQSRTFVALCQREQVITNRLIDTKVKIRDIAETLRVLIDGIAENPDPDPDSPETRRQLKTAAVDLAQQTIELRQGERLLQRELGRLDCDNLPSSRPFEP